MLTYGVYKVGELISFADYSLHMAKEEGYYQPDDTFSNQDGFMIAAAVTSYDGS